jgi:hypothetical protein
VETFNKGETWEVADNTIFSVFYVDAAKYPNGESYIYGRSQWQLFCLEPSK